MSWYMTEERELLRAAFRDFAETRVRPHVAKMEEEDANAGDLIREMGQLGFLGLDISEAYGGAGEDPINWALLLEELGKESHTVGFVTMLTALFNRMLDRVASEEIKQKYLVPSVAGDIIFGFSGNEAAGGTYMDGWQTKAEKVEGGWRINGSKVFITQVDVADYFVLVAKTKDHITFTQDGKIDGMAVFIVDAKAEGVKVGHIENKVDWKGSRTGSLYFENVFVPDEDFVGEMGANTFDAKDYAPFYGAVSLGSMKAVLETTKNYLKQREQFGATLWDSHESIRNDIARLYSKMSIMENAVYGTMENLKSGTTNPYECEALKTESSALLEAIASECIVLMGGVGTVYETGIERFYRDAKMPQLGCGSAKTGLSTIAMFL